MNYTVNTPYQPSLCSPSSRTGGDWVLWGHRLSLPQACSAEAGAAYMTCVFSRVPVCILMTAIGRQTASGSAMESSQPSQ